jgi:hypothetical protein
LAPLDLARARADVEALAAIERRSASPGERRSAELLAARLRDAGAADVRLQRFRFQHTFAHVQALLYGAGLVAARRGGVAGAALASAALVAYDLDFSGRWLGLRRVLPSSEGTNVLARVPARSERRRTLVLVAHHDAAHTGLMWDPRLATFAARRAADTATIPSFTTLPSLALAAVAAGSLAPRTRAGRRARAGGGALLALGLALAADVARGPTVPGASDNASGVAAVLWLVERFARDPLHATEVVVVLPGAEEPGMGGMAAWLRAEGRALDPATTLVLSLDTLGAGMPIVVRGEGPPRTVRYRAEDLAWADRGAARVGLEPPRRWRIGGYTDAALPLLAGLPTISLLSVDPGTGLFSDYHLPSDVPENVDWDSVEACIRIAEGTARAWAEGFAA